MGKIYQKEKDETKKEMEQNECHGGIPAIYKFFVPCFLGDPSNITRNSIKKFYQTSTLRHAWLGHLATDLSCTDFN